MSNLTYTRADYMNRVVDHQTYYSQYVEPGLIEAVVNAIGRNRILASTDYYLNDIELESWDRLKPLVASYVSSSTLKRMGEIWSLGTAVCIAKTAARMFIEQELQ